MSTYTMVYRAVVRNLTRTQFSTLWTAISHDTAPENQWGFTFVSDNVANGVPIDEVDRTIVYTGPPGMVDFLTNLNTAIFTKGLNAYVAVDPVVVT
jgi:hypothetical protein